MTEPANRNHHKFHHIFHDFSWFLSPYLIIIITISWFPGLGREAPPIPPPPVRFLSSLENMIKPVVTQKDCYLDLLLTNSTNLQILRRQCCLHQPGGRERVEVALDLGDTVLERQQPLPQKTLKHRPHARPMDVWVFFGYKHFSRVTRARNRTRRAKMRTKWNLWTNWRTKRWEQQQAETVIWMVFRPAWHTCKT